VGLLIEFAPMRWHSRNKKFYESKGYVFTKMDDEFKVKVEDLQDGSHILVNIECDGCNKKIINVMWKNYKKCVKEDGTYYCKKCASVLYGSRKSMKTKLKNGENSFKQWCINNYRQDILDKWDYDLNKINPSEINFSTNKKYYFKCPVKLHKSELKDIANFTTNGHNILCKACNSFAQWGIDNICVDFLEKYWDYDKNTVDPWDIEKSSINNIYIKCQEREYHNNYLVSCANFTSKNSRCPYCINHKLHTLDSLGTIYPNVLSIWSNKNVKSVYEYSPSSGESVYWKCLEGKHDDYKRSIHSSNGLNFRCPECVRERRESFLQEKTRLYLEKLGNNLLHENKCTIIPINPKTKHDLPFDNEVVELKLIIEVMGSQHYITSSWVNKTADRYNTTPEYQLHYQKLKDRYKRMYAKSKGYHYLEIPYWTDDKDETWKKLINDKISEISNQLKTAI